MLSNLSSIEFKGVYTPGDYSRGATWLDNNNNMVGKQGLLQ